MQLSLFDIPQPKIELDELFQAYFECRKNKRNTANALAFENTILFHAGKKQLLMEKSDIYGIAYGCPRMIRKKDCPLLVIEHLSFKEKVNWINELNDKKGNAILMYHTICTGK